MPNHDSDVLAPMVRTLQNRSQLAQSDVEALLGLPHRIGVIDHHRYIVREGDKASHCTLLLSGFAYRSKMAGNGARQILSFHLRGDVVDLHNTLLEKADHSVQTLTRVEVAYIPSAAILALVDAHPAIARALWRETLVDGSIFREWVLNVGRRDARQRIAHLLCEIVLRQKQAGLCEGPRYHLPMTQEQIGDATGLTSVHVNRTLQGMRKEGLISTTNRSVTIEDWRKLQAAGDFSSAYLHQPVASAA